MERASALANNAVRTAYYTTQCHHGAFDQNVKRIHIAVQQLIFKIEGKNACLSVIIFFPHDIIHMDSFVIDMNERP